MRLGITGASGFVGRHLCASLRALPEPPLLLTPSRAEAELLAPETLTALCLDADGRPVDALIHLAAYAHVNQVDRERLQAVNVTGTGNLLQAAIKAGVPHLIYVSSILADPALDKPRTAYGAAKWLSEQELLQAHAEGEIRVTILRPANVYGVGMKGNLMTLLRLIERRLLPPLPDFRQPFSLLAVEDLCAAIWLALQHPPSVASPAPVLPLTDGEAYTLRQVESAIRQALGRRQPRWSMPAPLLWLGVLGMEGASRLLRLDNGPGLRHWRTLTRNHQVDDSAARRLLGYNPQQTFYSALPALLSQRQSS